MIIVGQYNKGAKAAASGGLHRDTGKLCGVSGGFPIRASPFEDGVDKRTIDGRRLWGRDRARYTIRRRTSCTSAHDNPVFMFGPQRAVQATSRYQTQSSRADCRTVR